MAVARAQRGQRTTGKGETQPDADSEQQAVAAPAPDAPLPPPSPIIPTSSTLWRVLTQPTCRMCVARPWLLTWVLCLLSVSGREQVRSQQHRGPRIPQGTVAHTWRLPCLPVLRPAGQRHRGCPMERGRSLQADVAALRRPAAAAAGRSSRGWGGGRGSRRRH